MVKFLATSRTVTVNSASHESIRQLRQLLKIAVKNRFFAMRRRAGWDGTIDFYNPISNSFSRGLWPQIEAFLKKAALKYEFKTVNVNLLPRQLRSVTLYPNVELRSNQLAALNSWLSNCGYGIVWAPPGFGKTELAAAAIITLRHNINRTLFVVNSLDLLLQTQARLSTRLQQPVGIIGGNDWSPRRITVATVQTLYSKIKTIELKALLADTDLVIVDECHHSRSKQIRALLHATKAIYSLGLSARPFHNYSDDDLRTMTAEDATILACLGPVVYRETSSALIARGELAKPTVLLIPIKHDMIENLDWPATRQALFSDQVLLEYITALVTAAATADQASLVITGNSLQFNSAICDKLRSANVNAIELHGSMDKQYRQRARTALDRNDLKAIVATTIFDEGVDIPNLRQLVLAYGGRSLIKVEQRFGRGLRKKHSGNNVALIADFLHYGNRHLHAHSYVRLKRYMEEECYDLVLVMPQYHSNHVKRLLKDRVLTLDKLPDAEYYARFSSKTPTVVTP